jgi:hypothetical protein
MSYCRHENTAADLRQVIEMWDDFDESEENSHELAGRAAVIKNALTLVYDYGLTMDDADYLNKLAALRRREELGIE